MAEKIFIARQDTLEGVLESVEELLQKMGGSEDSDGSETAGSLMAKLNALYENTAQVSVFKSWNRYTFANSPNTSGGKISIEKVDPERCIVISERLRNTTDQQLLYDYTLSADQLTISHQTLSGTDQLRLGFTIIELY